MYNNNVTYDEKWNTPENKAALEKLERKFFDKSECGPHCPVGWAPEVLEMMETLQRELGFFHNEETIRGFYLRDTPKEWFVTGPWIGLFRSFYDNVLKKPKTLDRQTRTLVPKTIKQRCTAILDGFTAPIKYGFKALIMKYVNPVRNRIEKPKIRLGQLKEKCGSLTCYFHTNEAFKEYVENEVRKCEIKLAIKGCYYPIERFWDATHSYNIENEHRPDSVTITYGEYKGERTVNLKKTVYRTAMKELGLNLKEIEAKANLAKASKVDPL